MDAAFLCRNRRVTAGARHDVGAGRLVRVLAVAASVAVFAASAPAGAYGRPGTFELVSGTAAGRPANADSGYGTDDGAQGIAMTPDTRYVAFTSAASDLLPGDTDGLVDVFVRDRKTGRTTMASVPTVGSVVTKDIALPGCFGSDVPAISDNGRFVAFQSCVVNLIGVGKDTNLSYDVFVHDMKTGVTTLASVSSAGVEGDLSSQAPSISADGRYVAFQSDATNLASNVCTLPGAGCTVTASFTGYQVYVHDMVTGTTRLVSETPSGQVANGDAFHASISPDGRLVAFVTFADNLAGNDTNAAPTNPIAVPSAPDVYVRDLKTGSVRLVSVGLTGQAGGGADPESGAGGPSPNVFGLLSFSGDDRLLAFSSNASDLVPAGGHGVFVRDLVKNATELVSVNSAGQAGAAPLAGCSAGESGTLSRNGRYVAFACRPDPECPYSWVYATVYDRIAGALDAFAGHPAVAGSATECPSSANGDAEDDKPVLSGDGRFVAFASDEAPGRAANVSGAPPYQIYVRDRGRTLGVGGLAGSHKLTVSGAPEFGSTGLVSAADPSNVAALAADATLTDALVAYRARTQDLFVRLDVRRMPMYAAVSPAVVYGLDFVVDGARYQIRVGKTSPLTASFGLFRLDAGGWTPISTLRGGYGTTGQSVVVALPLADVGAQSGGRLSGLTAFSAVGSYFTGAAEIVNEITLSR